MRKCPIHNIELEEIEEELITGEIAKVEYCEKCNDTYIPENELKKYDDAKHLKKRLAEALETDPSKINVMRSENRLIIYQSS